jgi:hypothetical protein
MNQGPRRISLMKKNGGKKSRETIPLKTTLRLSSRSLNILWVTEPDRRTGNQKLQMYNSLYCTVHIKVIFKDESASHFLVG